MGYHCAININNGSADGPRKAREAMAHSYPGREMSPTVLAHEVEALQVAELFRNLPGGAAAALLGAFLCVAVLGEEGLKSAHVAWLGYGIAVGALRLGLWWAYRNGILVLDPSAWARLAVMGNLLAGIQWGLLGTLLFPEDPGPRQNFAIMVITCFVGGSITAYAPVRWAHPALSIPATVPSTLNIFLVESGPHLVSGAMAFFFIGMVLFYSLRETETVAQRLRADVRIRRKLHDLEASARERVAFPPPMGAPLRRS
jgi:hypothetical protein